MRTFDTARAMQGINPGQSLGQTFTTHDGLTIDSTGAFLVGELERLDQTLNLPLVEVTWDRDIDLREDITIADDYSSYTNTKIASPGGLGTGNGIGTGKAWMGKDSTAITGLAIDTAKFPNPLHVWGMELKYSIFELVTSAKLGRPIDDQLVTGTELKRQMDIDEQVYIGDLSLNIGGLLNSAAVTAVTNFPNGASGFSQWSKKTPDEILNDLNLMIVTAWTNSGYAIKPNRILLPPTQFAYIAIAKVATQSGLVSIRTYVEENNVISRGGGEKLQIEACKWCVGAGQGGTLGQAGTVDRAVIYSKNRRYVRFPITTLGRTPIQYDGLFHKWYYYHKMGGIEMPYANTIAYFDGL